MIIIRLYDSLLKSFVILVSKMNHSFAKFYLLSSMYQNIDSLSNNISVIHLLEIEQISR